MITGNIYCFFLVSAAFAYLEWTMHMLVRETPENVHWLSPGNLGKREEKKSVQIVCMDFFFFIWGCLQSSNRAKG
ncbi:hypothetical protein F5H01DRAFT_11951 [Linnemannia elongata]|nr:hypothetical protein F5H01DRAFT_11951 [Linnemannia elongata]